MEDGGKEKGGGVGEVVLEVLVPAHSVHIYTSICIYRYIFFELVNGERLHSGLKKHLGWSKKIILSTDYSRFERLIL